jgi:8-oxo-dGTP diphosphatase
MMEFIDKIAWMHVQERQLLCVRSHGRLLAYLPGGKRESGESDEACLVREIGEELGVTLRSDSIRPMGVYVGVADGQPDGTLVRLACYGADFQGRLIAGAEIAEIMWLDHGDLDRCSPTARLVLDDLHARSIIR